MTEQLHTRCIRCRRPLTALKSMQIGYGPKCARLAGVRPDACAHEDEQLVTITEPFTGDVVLRRTGDDTAGEVITNVPRSVIWHSPDGFNWGYGGSGVADLALNILNAFVPPGSDGLEPWNCHKGQCSATAGRLHQDFKWKFLAGMDIKGGIITAETIRAWIEAQRRRREQIPA